MPTPPSDARVTPIEEGMLARVVRGVRYAVSGEQGFFGPGQPLPPVAQDDAKGRAFDYPYAVNMQARPRQQESITFDQLRALADNYDLLRIILETRKDQLAAMEWSIQPRGFNPATENGEPAEADLAACEEIEEFLRFPDQEHTWDQWLRTLLDDLFVIDAPTIYPRMNLAGELYGFELVDGATIKRVIDQSGRTPLPPDPAYQQVIKGMPAVDYSRDELVYMPRNLRTYKLYGFSPVEQIVMTVNIAIRRQVHQLESYTEGNVPEAIIGVPPEWNPDQIAKFQNWWDTILSGNSAARRRARFVPGGVEYHPTKDALLKDEMDDWLARIVCFAFSVNPTPFLKQQNRATADNAAAQAISEGLLPAMRWIKNLMDLLIQKHMGRPDFEFSWSEQDGIGPMQQATIDKVYLDAKVKHPDEVRADLGLPPLTEGQKADLSPPPPPITPVAEGSQPNAGPPTPAKADVSQPPTAAGDDASSKLGKKKGYAQRGP